MTPLLENTFYPLYRLAGRGKISTRKIVSYSYIRGDAKEFLDSFQDENKFWGMHYRLRDKYRKDSLPGYGCIFHPTSDGKSATRIKMHTVLAPFYGILCPDDGVPREIDHRDLNPLNNTPDNLRWVTSEENAANRPPPASSKSGYKGVSPKGDQWLAAYRWKGKTIKIGLYPTREAAAAAYNRVALEVIGDCAYMNKDKKGEVML